jgi:N utilization substance protein A
MTEHNRSKRDETGPDSAGQSGDIQQISGTPGADSESVEELVEEGNAFEADAVEGVENAKDADVSEVTTREVPEDDVPEEYLDNDKDVA